MPEPVIHSTALCVADELYDPFSGEKFELFTKRDFMYIVMGVNFFTLIVSIFFFWLLEKRSR